MRTANFSCDRCGRTFENVDYDFPTARVTTSYNYIDHPDGPTTDRSMMEICAECTLGLELYLKGTPIEREHVGKVLGMPTYTSSGQAVSNTAGTGRPQPGIESLLSVWVGSREILATAIDPCSHLRLTWRSGGLLKSYTAYSDE